MGRLKPLDQSREPPAIYSQSSKPTKRLPAMGIVKLPRTLQLGFHY
jgi:hypothetical protein